MMSDTSYPNRLVEQSGALIRRRVDRINRDRTSLERMTHRPTMELIKGIVALAAAAGTVPDESTVAVLSGLLDHLVSLQLEGGLFSGGDNLVSPPDSAFTINDLCLTLELMQRRGCPDRIVSLVREPLLSIARKTAPAMVRGGVHTPNHRWEIASALVGLDLFLGDTDLKARAEQWLAEGIDIQADGLYSERSPNYAAHVSNPCLIALARRLNRSGYLDYVEANLEADAALMRPDGLMETIQSRRQDQNRPFDPEPFLSQARLLALVQGNTDVVSLALDLSSRQLADPTRHLAELLVDPRLAGPLPVRATEGPRKDPEAGPVRVRHYRETGMDRVLLSGDSWPGSLATASVYAGSDFPTTGRVASGLANNSTIMDFTTPLIQLTALRLSPNFFDLGPLRPQELEAMEHESTWTMHDRRTSGYYQPLDPEFRSPEGSYALTDEGRFFARMSFDRRRRDDMTLESDLRLSLRSDGFDLRVDFHGPVTSYACLLGLSGKDLRIGSGADRSPDGSWLVNGSDRVEVSAGPVDGAVALTLRYGGAPTGSPVTYDPGESYTFVNGDDAVEGRRLIFTGLTSAPFTLSGQFGVGQGKALKQIWEQARAMLG